LLNIEIKLKTEQAASRGLEVEMKSLNIETIIQNLQLEVQTHQSPNTQTHTQTQTFTHH